MRTAIERRLPEFSTLTPTLCLRAGEGATRVPESARRGCDARWRPREPPGDWSSPSQAEPLGPRNCMCTLFDAELDENVLDVRLHCLRRYPEVARDILV
jgi:hypothetical protein